MLGITIQFYRSQNMKVFVAVIFALGSVSALGSGPYLPSGWRPQGPAFYLPGEVQKPADVPLKETLILETEASGSDALREYGPPKVEDIAQNIIQGLPDVATEQTFFVNEAVVEDEVNAELRSEVQEVTTEILAEEVTEALRIADIQLQQDISTASYETEVNEQTTEVQKQEIQATEAVVEERASLVEIAAEVTEVAAEEAASVDTLEKIVQGEEKAVNNIAEAIISLEKEVKAEQIAAVETAAQLKATEEGSGVQVPEGFLEYGPPGFREYGPPQVGDLRSAIVQESDASFESNEARRRRYSPKLRVTKNKRHH